MSRFTTPNYCRTIFFPKQCFVPFLACCYNHGNKKKYNAVLHYNRIYWEAPSSVVPVDPVHNENYIWLKTFPTMRNFLTHHFSIQTATLFFFRNMHGKDQIVRKKKIQPSYKNNCFFWKQPPVMFCDHFVLPFIPQQSFLRKGVLHKSGKLTCLWDEQRLWWAKLPRKKFYHKIYIQK